MKKAIIPILVATLFLAVPAVSAMRTAPTEAGDQQVMSIMTGKDGNGLNIDKIPVTEDYVISFTNEIQNFKDWIAETRPFSDFKLTEEETAEIKSRIDIVLTPLNALLEENDLDPISTDWLYAEMFENELGRSTIVSMGIGYAYIPWYEYEAFFGTMLRPVWLFYLPLVMGGGGYTGNLNVNLLPFRIEYGDRLGAHIVRTTFFSGLYLNIGELGYDSMFGGIMIMLGRARVVM